MAGHKVLLYCDSKLSDTGRSVRDFFDAMLARSKEELLDCVEQETFNVLVFDAVSDEPIDKDSVIETVSFSEMLNIPLIVLSISASIQDKIDAMEVGCDDFIEPNVGVDEIRARITKSIFNKIATNQLSSRLELANMTAQNALVDNSELGLNIQFLLEVHQCDNLDQLGQLFFRTIERYGLKCSLQIRSDAEVKNMEAHGMAKDLESQLLMQLSDGERFIDFGRRTIVNYGKVSLLIKNMPTEDTLRYGTIKDNSFSLIQGMNARVLALEDRYYLLDEREALKNLSKEVGSVMKVIKDSYQKVMREIANEVEASTEKVLMRIPALSLMENDEYYLEDVMESCVRNTNKIFNDGLVIDQVMDQLDQTIDRDLKKLQVNDSNREASAPPKSDKGADVELF